VVTKKDTVQVLSFLMKRNKKRPYRTNVDTATY